MLKEYYLICPWIYNNFDQKQNEHGQRKYIARDTCRQF